MAEFIATLAAGLWAGAAFYISFSEHPSALKVGVRFATEYFRPMSKRTAPLMMVLAAVGGGAAIWAWLSEAGVWWLVGGVLLLGMFPFTAIFIVPTNLKLLKVDPLESGEEAAALHARWGRMHALRTMIGAVAFPLFLTLLLT